VKRNLSHIILAISMVLVLVIASTPADFIHRFAHHKDTVHTNHGGLSIDRQHHHCQFLGFVLDHFTPHMPLPFRNVPVVEHFTIVKPLFAERFIQRCIVATSLRGPPSAC
jgi:hypothetical protein